MKKLDWYILKKLLFTFVFVIILLEFIICVIDFTEKNDDFIKNEVNRILIWKYYLTFIPFIAGLITPIIVFITTVLVTVKLAARTEIIAMFATGMSFFRMLKSYVLAAIVIGTASFFLNGYVIPNGNKFRIGFEIENIKNPFFNTDKHIHLKIGKESYIYLYRYDNRRNQGSVVTLETIKDNKLIEKIHARRLKWVDSTKRWKIQSWQKRSISDSIEIIEKGEEIDTMINISPEDFGDKDRLQETMTMPELNAHIELQKSRGANDVHLYEIERYIRYMQPFSSLILVFIGVVVSSRKSRQGAGFQIALGFFIAFFYIIAFILAKAIAETGVFNMLISIWLPNIVFGVIAFLLYKTTSR